MLTKALFDSPKARPLRGRFRLLLHGFQSHYFRPQPLELVGGFAHRGPGVQVNRNAIGLPTQPLYNITFHACLLWRVTVILISQGYTRIVGAVVIIGRWL